ncbi:MAG: DNA translocase FtsK 4TM domain-containing protein, partial [Candidatus Rokubacteria bacterium]|nr:DNA translocase FtsK 4TM domain-containing protein [Candidatus Rokubacteria bacterium]
MARTRAKAPPTPRPRWVREAQGVVALGAAAYTAVALFSYEPRLHWLDQAAQVGVVGLWIGRALFTGLGYAGYLVPAALAAWAISAFARPLAAGVISTAIGLGLGLVGLAGLLARASGPSGGVWI